MSYIEKLTGTKTIKLSACDPEYDAGLTKEAGEARFKVLSKQLTELQELLYAAGQHSLLIVLQGRDTSGKDGTIKAVLGPLNALGCNVASFKVPTEKERAHDFLWRVHQQTPGKGEITIFNRSHYEDVLVVRVHELAPKAVWQARYDHINAFEKVVADSATIILKFYLHISKAAQEQRLIEREQDATKAWKLSAGDWQEREHWNAYTRAYEDALNRCNAKHAPWFIVPADRKWFRNLAVAEILRDTLKPFKAKWLEKLEADGLEKRTEIEEYRRGGKQSQ